MSDSRPAMVSEWMMNENINKFVKANRDANRFELVGVCSHSWLYPSLAKLILTGWGRCPGIDIHARGRDDTWSSEGGMVLRYSLLHLLTCFYLRPTS